MSAARAAAYAALLRAFTARRAIDRSPSALPELAALAPRDAALAVELVSGTLKRRLSLDAVLQAVAGVSTSSVPAAALTALRLGAYQLLYLDRVPVHAAVNESVALLSNRSRKTRGFVNAVLRRTAASGRDTLAELSAGADEGSLSVRWSCPPWLIHLLLTELGPQRAAAFLEAGNEPPERCVRVNRRVSSVEEAIRRLVDDGLTAEPLAGLPDALLVGGPPLERTAAFAEGLVVAQSRASQVAGLATVAAAHPGDAVADLCAAPGIKTSQLAAAIPGARLLAVEKDPRRCRDLRATLARLRVEEVAVMEADVLTLPGELDASFDVVLLDAPCSGLGTLASRPDVRWRRTGADVARLARLQRALLRRAAALLRPGGALVYSVCTITRAETVDVTDALLDEGGWMVEDLGAEYPELVHPQRGGTLLALPPRAGASGFFVTRLRRTIPRP